MSSKIKWAAHVTQMGGFAIGAEMSLGEPSYITTVPGFEKQDEYFRIYKKNVQYIKDEFIEKMDIVVSNPPCSGLSRLTSNNTSIEKKDSLNDLTITITKQIIISYNPEIIIGESSEGLFQKSGEKVFKCLQSLAIEHGYTISLYRTDTQFHGLPQSRKRTFYIFWKGKCSKIIGKIYVESPTLSVFLKNKYSSKEINPKLINNWAYVFIRDYLKINPRDLQSEIKSHQKNVFQYILEKDLFDECVEFYKDDKELQNKILKIKNKKSDGGNVILPYPRFWNDTINGITWKNMERSMHPHEDRSLSIREAMNLMGFPIEYPEVSITDTNLIGKNVPVNTAYTLIERVKQGLENKLKEIEGTIKEDNIELNKNIVDQW